MDVVVTYGWGYTTAFMGSVDSAWALSAGTPLSFPQLLDRGRDLLYGLQHDLHRICTSSETIGFLRPMGSHHVSPYTTISLPSIEAHFAHLRSDNYSLRCEAAVQGYLIWNATCIAWNKKLRVEPTSGSNSQCYWGPAPTGLSFRHYWIPAKTNSRLRVHFWRHASAISQLSNKLEKFGKSKRVESAPTDEKQSLAIA